MGTRSFANTSERVNARLPTLFDWWQSFFRLEDDLDLGWYLITHLHMQTILVLSCPVRSLIILYHFISFYSLTWCINSLCPADKLKFTYTYTVRSERTNGIYIILYLIQYYSASHRLIARN